MDIGLALFTYCRPWHTEQVLNSLKKNSFSNIYIFQDGLKDEKDRRDWEKVNFLINSAYVNASKIFVSSENKGLANSIISGMEYVFNRHQYGIALEDDIVLGRGYSDYMELCFKKYEKNKFVSCIAGCGMPVEIPMDYQFDVFFSWRMSSAAWGTWADRWKNYRRDNNLLASVHNDPEAEEVFNKSGNDLDGIFQDQIRGRIDSWAIYWALLQIKEKAVCVLPSRYLAKDIGHDGAHGTNSKGHTSRFDTVLEDVSSFDICFPEEIYVDNRIQKQIQDAYGIFNLNKIHMDQIELYRLWICFLQQGESLENRLEKFFKDGLWIYGDGATASLLVSKQEVANNIRGIIALDKKTDSFIGCPVYSIKDMECQAGYCIVTPVYDMDYIKRSLYGIFDEDRIIDLREIFK